jgi:hypothetical protein
MARLCRKFDAAMGVGTAVSVGKTQAALPTQLVDMARLCRQSDAAMGVGTAVCVCKTQAALPTQLVDMARLCRKFDAVMGLKRQPLLLLSWCRATSGYKRFMSDINSTH